MRKAVFLDRDGTLIKNHHYQCDPNGIELMEGVVEGLKLLAERGFLPIVVTNQSGIARGYYTEEQLMVMHHRLNEILLQNGTGIFAFYYCPHHPDGVVPRYSKICNCRKPKPGMVLQACSDLGIDPTQSWMVGDILDDVEAGKRAGCRAILLDLGTEAEPECPEREPEFVAADFLSAAKYLLEHDAALAFSKLDPFTEKELRLGLLSDYREGKRLIPPETVNKCDIDGDGGEAGPAATTSSNVPNDLKSIRMGDNPGEEPDE